MSALLTALGRLAAAQRSGRLAAELTAHFPLDMQALIRKRFGADAPGDRRDPRIRDDESVRAPLQMLANLLSVWERHSIGDLLDVGLTEGTPAS